MHAHTHVCMCVCVCVVSKPLHKVSPFELLSASSQLDRPAIVVFTGHLNISSVSIPLIKAEAISYL